MKPQGLIVPLVTPARGGKPLPGEAARLARVLTGRGAQVFPVSTTGEGPLLRPEDRVRLVEAVVEESRGPVWAGTAANSAEETVRLAREMLDRGAAGIVVVTPFYYPLTQEALHDYYTRVLTRVDAPVIAYTIPSHTCNRLAPETVERLAEEHSNLAAVKVTTEDARYLVEMIMALRGVHTRVLPGSVTLIPVARAYGIDSAILAVGNILPRTAQQALNGGLETAYPLLARAAHALQRAPTPCTIKTILARLGIITGAECLGPLRHEATPEPPTWLLEEAQRELGPGNT